MTKGERMKEKVKKDILKTLNESFTYLSDGFEDPVKNGIIKLAEFSKEFGEKEVAEYVNEQDGGDCHFIYYLALSGNRAAEPFLRKYLDSDDEDEIFTAASGLTALGIEGGYEILEQFENGTHPLIKNIGIDDLIETLQKIISFLDVEKAKLMLKRIKKR